MTEETTILRFINKTYTKMQKNAKKPSDKF